MRVTLGRALVAGERHRGEQSAGRGAESGESGSRVGGGAELGEELLPGVVRPGLVVERAHVPLVVTLVDGVEVAGHERGGLSRAGLLGGAGPDRHREAAGCGRRGARPASAPDRGRRESGGARRSARSATHSPRGPEGTAWTGGPG